MVEPRREFGDLLSEGLKSIAARERKALLALEDELGYELGVTRWAVEKWRQGAIPTDPKVLAGLARACVRRGGMNDVWLGHFLTLAEHPNKDALVKEMFPDSSDAPPGIPTNLPRRPYECFVGRERELEQLRRFLSAKHRVGVVCLTGLGGVGKTALALEMAHRLREEFPSLPADQRFEAIVWVTAKQSELLPTGLTTRRPTFTDLDGLYRALAKVLDLPAITRAATREEQDVIVARALAEHRVLLILDNLEEVDDPSLTIFLRDLPTPSKAIVTTRHRIDVAAPIPLQILNEVDAGKLIQAECERHALTLSDDAGEKLLQRTGGLPLAIVRMIGRMAWRGSSVEAELRQFGDPASDLYQFCFEKSIALIRRGDAHRLFMVFPNFAGSVSRQALGYVAGFEEDVLSRDEGLSDLEILSLVNKEGDRFGMDPLTKLQAQAELAAEPDFDHEARARWIEYYLDFVGRRVIRDGPDVRYWNSLGGGGLIPIDPEWPNILNLLRWADQNQDHRTLLDLMLLVIHYMDRRALYADRLHYARKAAEAANKLGEGVYEALLRIDGLGHILIEVGRYAEAEIVIEEGQRIIAHLDPQSADTRDLRTLAYEKLAKMQLYQGNLALAAALLDEAAASDCHPWIRERVAFHSGDLAFRQGEYDKALKLYSQCIDLEKQFGGEGLSDPEILSHSGFVYLALSNPIQAKQLFLRSLALAPQTGAVQVAESLLGLAIVARVEGHTDEARRLAQEAHDLLSRSAHRHILLWAIDEFMGSL